MTPPTSLTGSPDQSIASLPQQRSSDERPERSRNAKAQARHRAKRKAYIEQLEETVTKLQSVLALSSDQVTALPPPLVRIRELEHENELLHREIEELCRQIELKNAQLRPDLSSRTELPTPSDDHRFEREGKRRRMADRGASYIEPNPPHGHRPPPPLSNPQTSHHYVQSQPQPNMQQTYSRPNSSFFAYGLAYPATSSASSATSSPPFSPSEYAPQHAQSHHRNTSASSQQIDSPQYPRAHNHHELVKLEEESYNSHHPLPAHTNGYTTNLYASTTVQAAIPHWQTYSAKRT